MVDLGAEQTIIDNSAYGRGLPVKHKHVQMDFCLKVCLPIDYRIQANVRYNGQTVWAYTAADCFTVTSIGYDFENKWCGNWNSPASYNNATDSNATLFMDVRG
ncbi:MAG: hypothetical protein JWN52_4658 [Actinomycetia bacterium]|nr:hypothetical protein [Actinomycetes bacterium]